MSGIFKFNDKNSPKPSLSSPASLTTPTRHSRLGLFMGAHDNASVMETSFNTNNVQPSKPSFSTNCPSSPAQGRSLREFEDQMAALRKENFNLKLRIYFLEEKPAAAPTFHGLVNSTSCPNIDSIESISRQNIDLKVENESLRKELQEKQELLCQASKAMELMENQHKKESIEAQMIIDDLNHKIEAMTHEIKTFEKAFIESSKNHDTGFSDFLGAIDSKDIEAQRKIAEFELIMRSFSDQNEQLCQKIEKMEHERCEITRKLNQLNYENSELKEKLDETVQMSDKDEIKKLQDECYDGKRKLADALTKFDEIEKKFQEKSEAHEKSLEVIKKACEHIEDLELHVEQLKSSQPNSLSSTESAKNDARSDDNFSHANGLILKLRQQVELITIEKNDEINRLKEELQSRITFLPLCNSSTLNVSSTQSILQSINFPTNESSFNEVIEKNRSAQNRIHFLKHKLSTNDSKNKIENEFLQLQLKSAQNDLHESESALRQSVNFCGVLLIRIEELVKFLNSLLQKKDLFGGLLGYELKKAITRAVDRSFDLSQSSNFTQNASINLSEMSMIDLVDSFASSTIANSMIDSLNSDNFQLKTENDSNSKMKASQASNKGHKSLRNTRKSFASMLLKQPSESEEWSEPDRDISKERIGLSTADEKPHRTSTTSDEEDDNDAGSEHKLVRKSDWRLIHEKVKSLENLLQEKNDKILEVSGMLLDAEKDANEKILQFKKKLDEAEKDIQHYKSLYHQATDDKNELLRGIQEKNSTIENMKSEKDKINVELKVLSSKYETQLDINQSLKGRCQEEEERLHKLELEYESKCKVHDQLVAAFEKRENSFKDELQQNWIRKTIYTQMLNEFEKKQERLKDYQLKFSAMEEEMKIMQNHVLESEDRLEKISRNLDTATLQLSTASLERSKALNEKRTLESKYKKMSDEYQKLNIEKQEANLKIADLEVFNAKLQNKLLIGGSDKIILGNHFSDASGYASEDANAMRSTSFSSDEKDFLSLEAYSNCMSCKKLANEMNEIRKNLNQSKRSLEQAYSKLRNQNLRKAQIEMDIKQQIVKTQSVLQTVRTNMEQELIRGVPGIKKDEQLRKT